jgi:hypothetical protein
MMRTFKPSPSMMVALLALGVAVGGTAYATGEGDPLLGGVRNPGSDPSSALTKETQIIADVSRYGTRQSNKSPSGGGAIYGCRSGAGGTPAGNEPCVRANNLAGGLAFEFQSAGAQAGTITTADPSGRPFTTNATGVATGLNADRLDGRDGADLLGRTETAQSALTAQSAVTAQNVGGVEARRISHRSASPANATVLDLRGFRLRVECQSGNEKLFAETSVADGELVSVSTSATGQPAQNYWDDDFTPGESLNLTLTASSNDRLYDIVYNGGDGAVVSVQVVTDDDIGADDCIVGGHALG